MNNTRIFPLKNILLSALLCVLPTARAADTVSAAGGSRPWIADRLSVCVYCGASDLTEPKYSEVAREIGAALAGRGWTLVWGGGRTGLMGAVARGAKESGGRVVGVIPEFIRQWEKLYDQADEMMVVTTMQERKMILQARSDAFVVLPGGFGTLDELGDTFELLNLSQHNKPVILLNQDGYYDALLAFIDRMVAEKFSGSKARERLWVARNIAEVLDMLERIETARGQ